MAGFRVVVGGCVAALALAACQHQSTPKTQAMDEHMAHMAAGDMAMPQMWPSAEQGDPKLPPSARTSAARLSASPRHGEWVRVPYEPGSKDSLEAYIVYPTNSSAKAPVVVVIHEIFGLSGWIRSVADQAAAEGFIAIAPDLNSKLRGKPSADSISADSARKLSGLVPAAERNQAIAAVAKYAMSQPSATQRYAVIGYCYGGSTVWMHAVNGGVPGYSGGVAFYGLPYMSGPVPNADSLKKINKPVMLLSGSKDARIGAAMPAVDSAMKALGKWYYGSNYPGAIHGFLRAQDDPKSPTRDEAEEKANLDATKDAWPRTVKFLKDNLGVK